MHVTSDWRKGNGTTRKKVAVRAAVVYSLYSLQFFVVQTATSHPLSIMYDQRTTLSVLVAVCVVYARVFLRMCWSVGCCMNQGVGPENIRRAAGGAALGGVAPLLRVCAAGVGLQPEDRPPAATGEGGL